MRSIQAGPSSSMKNVSKKIVIAPTIRVRTLFVIETAAPESPKSFFARRS